MKFLDKPLTLEELESYYAESEYIGQIALIQNDGIKALAILDHRDDDGMCVYFAASGRYLREKDYGKTWWAFPYVENEIDRDKWELCGECVPNCSWCKYYNEELRHMPKVCEDCKHKSNYEPEYKFCYECGRPLTKDAWADLEKRIRR